MNTKVIHKIGPFFGLLLFGVALIVLYHELRIYHLHDIVQDIKGVPPYHLLLAFSLTMLSYLLLTGYDTLAMMYVKHPLPYGKIALASFTGYAFSNNIGLSMIAGSSVRYRLYSTWGLTTLEITKVVAFCIITLWLGFFTLGGTVFIMEPLALPTQLKFPFHSVHVLGWVFLFIVAAFVVWTFMVKKPIRIRAWAFPLPSPRLLIAQIAVASLDWAIAGAVLYTLLPAAPGFSFPVFLSLYLLAQIAGMVSQVPGGLGVFEAMILLLLSKTHSASQVLGSLLAFRGIYYILPLLTASILLGYQEMLQKRETVKKMTRVFSDSLSAVIPLAFSLTTFLSGAILLFSGVLPATHWRLTWLNHFLPLPVMELSHFLGSIIGVMLLFLARGIQRRMDAAYILTVTLLGAGILFSLLKGLDYEEAIILTIMLIVLLPCRRYFYRKGSLVSQRFRPGWIAAIILVLFSSVWLGFFSFKHVEYSNDLWWRFMLHGDAPRFLRAMVGVIGVVFVFLTARFLKPSPPKAASFGFEDTDSVVPIVRAAHKSYANLALLGDKRFLFNEKRNAFIMYGVEGRSWIAMGDPIGPKEEWPDLIWRFREQCDRFDGWTVFYEVYPETLHLYLDLGLTLLKLGEEGRVSLETFSLEGSAHKGLRYTAHRFERDGCIFEIIPAEEVYNLLPEFKIISNLWLKEKNTREKGFSLGFFKEDYLKRFPAGVVRKEGRVLGFTNVWIGADKKELSIDLMRYRPDAPNGLMEYLFIQLMLWGKQEGYEWFNLGMAPLSGLEEHDLAPLWSRLGAFVFHHGEHFYNLQGLRAYKEKFDPIWKPKYLASPGGFSLPRILSNIASLISGSMKGVVAR
jgi:phosphatidylglycerol lysyltransferase